jgi:hypothetical protein
MRKFRTSSSRSLPFRLLVIVAGALLLLAAFAPSANADCPACIRFYDFDGLPPDPTYGLNLQSHMPALQQGAGTNLTLTTTGGAPYPAIRTSVEAGLPVNVPVGAQANLNSLGLHRSGAGPLNINMPFFSATGIYNITSISFAVAGNGNGFRNVNLLISTNGGTTFTTLSGPLAIPNGPGAILTFTIPAGTTLNIPSLVLQLNFTNGQSNGNDLQNQIDNIQVNGSVVPEPATVAGGLLGVLGLCWFQRRRLISAVRLRRASG